MDDPAAARKVGGRYRLLIALGAGGMGTVWRAYDELLGREVAVKEVRLPDGLGDEDREILLARTMREARTAAQLDEVHVVRVYDVVEDDHRPWIVMELVEGTSLGQRVRVDGPLPSAVVAQIGLSVLSALAAAHAAGILHRDVKPSNVVLAEDGQVVLTDFGVATADGDVTLTATGMLIGSPSYLSPERARGQPGGPPSDLWSLGATLYAAVEGRPPFERGDALSTITAAIVEPHDPPTRASPDLAHAIDGLLAKEPADRLGPAEAEAILQAAAVGSTADLRPLGAHEAAAAAPRQGSRRNRCLHRSPGRGRWDDGASRCWHWRRHWPQVQPSRWCSCPGWAPTRATPAGWRAARRLVRVRRRGRAPRRQPRRVRRSARPHRLVRPHRSPRPRRRAHPPSPGAPCPTASGCTRTRPASALPYRPTGPWIAATPRAWTSWTRPVAGSCGSTRPTRRRPTRTTTGSRRSPPSPTG